MFAASKSGRTVSAPTTDTLFPYVPLLLNTTSTNGQQNNTFLDSSTNNFTITRNGTPPQGSVTPYWPNGQWSNYFNGSPDYLYNSSNNVALQMGTGDYTVEFWAYSLGFFSGFPVFLEIGRPSAAAGVGFQIDINTTGKVVVYGGTGTGTLLVTSSQAISQYNWSHIALVRSSAGTKLYINGSQSGSTASDSTNYTNGYLWIGVNAGGASSFYTGYLSNIRVVKGTAVYTADFTPSTTPLTAITNTSLLTCQSNRFRDNSTNNFTLTANGTSRVQAFQPFSPAASYTAAAYGGSGYFNGSTDYLSLADNTALQLGTGDFTIEGWFYISGATSTAYNLISKGAAATGWSLNTTTGARIQFSYTASNLTGATTTLVQGAWYHIAVVRSGSASGNLKIYINGVQEIASAGAVNDDFNQTSTMYISASRTATLPLNGYSSNVRVVKGTAVYTAAFTPPTTPLTAITNTSLLANYTNAGIYDAAVQNNVITVGDAQASTTVSKWSPTSMKFDGAGDYLYQPDSLGLKLATGDYTIEFWAYPTGSFAGFPVILEIGRPSGSPGVGLQIDINTIGNVVVYGGALTATLLITSASTISVNNWYYIALVRSSAGTKLYINGSQSGSTATDTTNYSSANLWVGANAGGATSLYTGYLQDLRVTKYARTITTPTAAFPTS